MFENEAELRKTAERIVADMISVDLVKRKSIPTIAWAKSEAHGDALRRILRPV